MICPVRINNTLDFCNQLTDGLSAGQTVVCLADFFEAKRCFIKQWLECARIRNLGQLCQYGAVFFPLVVVQHRDQHEDNVQRQAFKV